MSDVFVSYKAEDRKRVRPLVEALEADGLMVWWDAQIGGGDEWRRAIEQQLDAAKCVLVVWSKRSTGPEGRFVRDEASRAQRRRTYLPVRIDKVEPPLGFGEIQALPLTGWKGDPADQRYEAVLEAARSIIAGEPFHGFMRSAAGVGISRRTAIAGGAVAAAAVGGGAWMLLKRGAAGATDSIAVLPFANLSGDPAQTYFSDGIAEELRTALSRIAGLKVVGRTSSEMVRDDDAKTAARKLRVANILTGSVRRSPSTIRVNAQLVDARNGLERWSEAYDRTAGDVLQIQSDIARKVAEALRVRLAQANQAALAIGGTANAAAHDLFLRAMAIRQAEHTESNFRQAIRLFAAATQLDPNYARAYAEWSTAVSELSGFFATDAAQFEAGTAEATVIARRAIALAPDLGSAHAALAMALGGRLDFHGALKEFQRAAAHPDLSAEMLGLYSVFLMHMGDSSKALEFADKGIALDPLNPKALGMRTHALFYSRRYGDAANSARQVLKLSPKRINSLFWLGNSLLLLGKSAEARAAYSQIPSDDFFRLTFEAILEARVGNRDTSKSRLEKLRQLYGQAASYQFAQIHAQRGEINEAFAALEVARNVLDPGLSMLKVDPFLDPLRNDSRYKTLVEKLNFPPIA